MCIALSRFIIYSGPNCSLYHLARVSTYSEYEVSQFIERCKKAEPLSSLTDGIHLHTLSCPDEAAFERTKSALRALRVLLEENGN